MKLKIFENKTKKGEPRKNDVATVLITPFKLAINLKMQERLGVTKGSLIYLTIDEESDVENPDFYLTTNFENGLKLGHAGKTTVLTVASNRLITRMPKLKLGSYDLLEPVEFENRQWYKLKFTEEYKNKREKK